MSNLDVKFSLPSVDFDKNLVRGRVIRLFTLREDKYARALEEAAGGAAEGEREGGEVGEGGEGEVEAAVAKLRGKTARSVTRI